MSSSKKLGRWKRFEIAFAEGNWRERMAFPTSRPQNVGKTRDLDKIEKDGFGVEGDLGEIGDKSALGEAGETTSTKRSDSTSAPSDFSAPSDSASPPPVSPSEVATRPERCRSPQSAFRPGKSPTLWQDAREKKKAEKKRDKRR